MPLTKNQIRLTATGACLSKVLLIACRVSSCDQKLHGFKVKITKYQLKKQIGLGLNKNRQYNILGFDFNMPSDSKSFRDFRARVLQNIQVFFSPLQF